MPITTRSVLGGAALMIVGIVLGAVAGTSEPVFSDEPDAVNLIRLPNGPLGRYRMVSSSNELYMNDTETGDLWVYAASNRQWRRLTGGPKLAADAKPGVKQETTVERK